MNIFFVCSLFDLKNIHLFDFACGGAKMSIQSIILQNIDNIFTAFVYIFINKKIQKMNKIVDRIMQIMYNLINDFKRKRLFLALKIND